MGRNFEVELFEDERAVAENTFLSAAPMVSFRHGVYNSLQLHSMTY